MKNSKKILEGIVGSQGFEKLEKAIYRRNTQNVADPLELYLPLLVVPRTLLSWLVQNIKPMKVGTYQDLKFPGQDDITIHIEKQNTDTYRGEFIKEGKVIHDFDKQTLPSIGGHLMTVGEVYDFEEKIEGGLADGQPDGKYPQNQIKEGIGVEMEHTNDPSIAKEIAKDHLEERSDYYTRLRSIESDDKACGGDMVSAMMGMSGISQDIRAHKHLAEAQKWMFAHQNIKELTGTIGKLVDALVAKQLSSETFTTALGSIGKEEMKVKTGVEDSIYPEPKTPDPGVKAGRYLTYDDIKRLARENKKPESQKVQPEQETQVEKKAEKPAGAAQPRQPVEPRQPVMPSKQPVAAAAKQAQASAQGKVAGPKTPAGPKDPTGAVATPKAPPAPKGPAGPAGPSAPTAKAEFEGRTTVSGYFKKRLNKAQIKKTEKSFYVSESEVYKPCIHCEVPEFIKSEDGTPKFKPCACFYTETKDVKGKDRTFVEINKSENGMYTLEFNKSADPDSVRAFLLTLKMDLLLKKRFGNGE